jgi:hypothetical protein
MKKPTTDRLYHDYLLNEWLKKEANQIQIVHKVFHNKPSFVLKDVERILNFKLLPFDFEDPQNMNVRQFESEYKEKYKKLPFEKLQEKKIKDYLIIAIVKDIMGLSHQVNILCTVRSKWKRAPYMFYRLRDEIEWLEVEENLDTNIARLDMINYIGNRFFQTVILTVEDNNKRGYGVAYVSGWFVYQVAINNGQVIDKSRLLAMDKVWG